MNRDYIMQKSAEEEYKVIINADDFGITEGVNKAIIRLAENRIATSTSVMTNMPHYQEITKLKSHIGIGVHINLSTGEPVSPIERVPTLVGNDRHFFQISRLIEKTKRNEISEKDVETEIDAQIGRLINLGISADHLNTHHSLLKHPFFLSVITKAAKKHKIFAVRTYRPRKFQYQRLLNPKKAIISLFLIYQKLRIARVGFDVADKYDSLLKMGLSVESAIAKLEDIFHHLPKGVLELIIHPGYCNGDNAVLGEYVHEREAELQALLSHEFRKTVENSNVQLISFKDLQNKIDRL